jgi:hypothetical protein
VDLQEVADMEQSSDPERFVVRQTVETLRRLGGQPELAKTLAERLDEDERAQEISAGHAQRQRLQRQLSLTQARLERTRARLEALRTRNKGLAQRNRLLTARYSGRRYRLADAFVSIALRLPGLG